MEYIIDNKCIELKYIQNKMYSLYSKSEKR